MTDRRLSLLVLLAGALLCYAFLGTMPLFDPDEGRYANIPQEMLATGDLVTPRLNGVNYIEKPPLYYWMCAGSLALFGENEFGARFATASMTLLGIVLAFLAGREFYGRREGVAAAAIIATSPFGYVVGRLNAIDMTLGVLIALSILPGWLYLSERQRGKAWLYAAYIFAALAFLAKGLVGIVFPTGAIFVAAAFTGRWRRILSMVSPVGLILFAAVAGPWVVAMAKRDPDFLNFFFVQEHFQRYTSTMHSHDEPFWYFVPVLAAGFLFALPFLPGALRAALSRRGTTDSATRESTLFLVAWPLFVVGFYSMSGSKLATYMTPVFVPLSVLFGRGVVRWIDDGAPWLAKSAFATIPLGLAGAVAMLLVPKLAKLPPGDPGASMLLLLPPAILLFAWGASPLLASRLGPVRTLAFSGVAAALLLASLNPGAGEIIGAKRSGKVLAEIVNAQIAPGDVVAQYGTYLHGLTFYTKRRTVIVDSFGELSYGVSRAPDRAERFPDREGFKRLWHSEKRVFALFHRDFDPLLRAEFPEARLLARSRRGILVVNR